MGGKEAGHKPSGARGLHHRPCTPRRAASDRRMVGRREIERNQTPTSTRRLLTHGAMLAVHLMMVRTSRNRESTVVLRKQGFIKEENRHFLFLYFKLHPSVEASKLSGQNIKIPLSFNSRLSFDVTFPSTPLCRF